MSAAEWDSATNDAAERFIRQIRLERQKGYGFVPLIGAGLSAPSGVPLTREITAYVKRCIGLALGVTAEGGVVPRPWNPRTDQWPPFIDGNHLEPPDWQALIAKVVEDRKKDKRGRSYLVKDDELPVFKQALGAMEEWSSSLQFLSRLTRIAGGSAADGGQESPGILALDAPRPEIIDACFREALQGKGPGLGHRMLAMLAGALRADLLLTTNFEDLLERGFAVSRNSLEVCEVPLGGHLPQWSSVSDTRTLIKLHGHRQGLRADYTLDAPASELDRRCFLEYLRAERDDGDAETKKNQTFRNHLLVIGHSLSELRTRGLIEHAWRYLNDEFRVFWLCHSAKDVERVRLFTESALHDTHGSIVLRYPDPGLFLLHFYQRLRRNLPAYTGLFPSPSRLPFPPLESARAPVCTKDQKASPEISQFQRALEGQLSTFLEQSKLRDQQSKSLDPSKVEMGECRFIVATSAPRVYGVTTACAEVFRRLEEHRDQPTKCLWLDMNDIASADNLFETLLEAAYFRLGLEHWTPCYIASDPKERSRTKEIDRLVSSLNHPWVVFLNARETPGANTSSNESDHGWLDVERCRLKSADASGCVDAFVTLIKELCFRGRAISVVLLCRELHETSTLRKAISQAGLDRHIIPLEGVRADLEASAVADKVIDWMHDDPKLARDRQRFLHALVLMQRPRPLACIWSAAVTPPRDAGTDCMLVPDDEQLIGWLNDLEDKGLIRRKAGGFIWMHCRCRQALRKIFGSDGAAMQSQKDEPQIHRQLADWYIKVLDCSPTPPAVFEVVYHLCRSATTALQHGTGDDSNQDALGWATQNVIAACAVLRTHRFLIQTRGYSRESCRRVEHIRETLCPDIVNQFDSKSGDTLRANVLQLRIICTDIMRAVAREVGEDSKAYLRHREAVLLRTDEPLENARVFGEVKYAPLLAGRKLQSPEDWVRWLRFWRWSGMLAIASRSFTQAEHSLGRALRDAISASRDRAGNPSLDDWSQLPACSLPAQWEESEQESNKEFKKESRKKHDQQPLRVEALRSAEQYVALELHMDGVHQRRHDLRLDGGAAAQRESRMAALARIEEHIDCAQQLAALIRDQDDAPGSHNTVTAVWCQSRLLMHRSSCKIRRVHLGEERKYREPQTAMSLLGDAEACLRVADPQRYRSDLALIDLYRGEVRLRLAESRQVMSLDGKSSISLADFCHALEERTPLESRRMSHRDLTAEIHWQAKAPETLGHMRALVGDALRFFARAEPVLRERRRNVWWTTWFFERKLRAIALSVWLSAFDRKGPIPFLGFEAAAFGMDTAADSLLDIGTRMIRVDSYRLATIVDAYMSCAKALQVRLLVDDELHESSLYSGRQQHMANKLNGAVKSLDMVITARDKAADDAGTNAKVDQDVAGLVTAIRQRCANVADNHLLPMP